MVTHRRIPVTDELGAVGTPVVAVPVGGHLDVDLRLEAVLEGVLASGTVQADAEGVCVRCLDPVQVAVSAGFQELFAYGDRAAHLHEVGADDEDDHVLFGDLLDLEPVLLDTVVPALPYQPVCRADCPGLCDRCGARLADNPGHAHEEFDPRWAALADLASSPTPGPRRSGEHHPLQEKRN